MLIIRDEQMHALRRHVREPYIESLVCEVRKYFPEQFEAMSENGVRAFIERVIAKGQVCGVNTCRAVAALAQLMLTFGEDFERSPDQAWAESLLSQNSLPVEVKLGLMCNRMFGCPAVFLVN